MSEDDTLPRVSRVPPGVLDDPYFAQKYVIDRELGEGGAGIVFCARHRELGEYRAIKFLHAEKGDQEAIVRFKREACAASKVKGDHVVRILDVMTTQGGVPYVVMEYLKGSDLERMLLESDSPLPVRDAVDFVIQACEALAQCHSVGIVHRDLKPSNLFYTEDVDQLPLIKVLDFGISKVQSSTNDHQPLTARNTLMGSPAYMSPEQFATPGSVDHRADIWALGVILYELVTGKRPFDVGQSPYTAFEAVKYHTPPAIEQLRRDAPRALAPIVFRCLEKAPAARFQNVGDLATALLTLAPEHCKATVARIVRIIDASIPAEAAPAIPLSGRPSSGGAITMSLRNAQSQAGSRKLLGGALGVATGLLAVMAMVRKPATETTSTSVTRPSSGPSAAQSPTPSAPPASTASSGAATETDTAAPSPSTTQTVKVESRSRPRTRMHDEATRPALEVATAGAPSALGQREAVAPGADAGTDQTPQPKPSTWLVDIVPQRKSKQRASHD
jgi:serine/threonine protein kinase